MTGWSEPAGSPHTQHALTPGTVVGGRYEIVKLLGRGGMGAVCQAHDREVDRTVALKIIRSDWAGDASVLQRFKRELILAQRVTHPNVVRIHDLGVAGELRFITMEYIDGVDLRQLAAEKGKLEPREAAGIVRQVCQGLAAAHAVGIVHRDLKPANIMVDRQGRVVVMDFGIARSIESAPEARVPETADAAGSDLTGVGQVVGTPVFMSPEQARRQPIDHRSDIFAAGLLLYSLISGKPPASASTVREMLRARASQRIRPLIEVDPAVAPQLNDIVMRCLELEPERRYQSAEELARALGGWSAGQAPQQPVRTVRRKIGIAAGAAVAMAALSVAAYFGLSTGPPAAHQAVKVIVGDLANTTGNPNLDGAIEPMLAVNLEGASFITVYNRGQARRLAAQLSGSADLALQSCRLVAQREGVDVVVTGSVSREGNRYRLALQAVDAATGKRITGQSAAVGAPEDLARALSETAAQIRKHLGDATPIAAQMAAAETFSSRSLEASHAYAEAQESLWKGKLDDALGAYRRAIQIDPDFGRAYAGMAVALANLDRRKESEEMYRLALSKIDRMSDREKYRTRGGYYLLRRDYDQGAEQFQQLVKKYPADTAGLGNLALANFYQRNMTAAVEVGRRAVAIYPGNVLQSNNVGLYEMYAGDFEGAIRDFQRVLSLNPAYERAYVGLGLSQLAQGHAAEAEAAYKKLASLTPRGASTAALALADLALYEGRSGEAASTLEAAIRLDTAAGESARAAVKWMALADAWLAVGKPAQATGAAARALAANPEEQVQYAAAIVQIHAGEDQKAAALATQLAARLGPEPEIFAKLIEAERKLAHREFREAVNLFQAAQKVADTWLGRYGLGRAYLGLGAFAEADAEFETCLRRRGEATAVFLDDQPSYRYFPAVYYYAGRAQEGLGSPGAAEAYKTLLKIKQRSVGDALVEDARRRVK